MLGHTQQGLKSAASILSFVLESKGPSELGEIRESEWSVEGLFLRTLAMEKNDESSMIKKTQLTPLPKTKTT